MFNYNSYFQAMTDLDEKMRHVRFIQACVGGEIEKVNLLLDNKNLNVDINFKDSQGNDGFRWACIYKHENVVQELLIKYDYNLSKRNMNYLNKRNEAMNGELDDILKMIETQKLYNLLSKSLKTTSLKSKKNKI